MITTISISGTFFRVTGEHIPAARPSFDDPGNDEDFEVEHVTTYSGDDLSQYFADHDDAMAEVIKACLEVVHERDHETAMINERMARHELAGVP